ncbi:translation initiation factor 3, RNA-binding subunit [Ramicandelaber brevisporus]|nr:translation initiation factor 3, RNA-binding subunit [Ramicandelaber brevisporus]
MSANIDNWDLEDEREYTYDSHPVPDYEDLPVKHVFPDPNGDETIKYIVEYKLDESRKRVKIVQKIQRRKVTEQVNVSVAERKKWAKFGADKGKPPGPDTATTIISEVVLLKLTSGRRTAAAQQAAAAEQAAIIAGATLGGEETEDGAGASNLQASAIVCRYCGGDHFTTRCPFKDTFGNPDAPGGGRDAGAAAGAEEGGSRYVPPHLRSGAAGAGAPDDSPYGKRNKDNDVRISNLSDDVTEDDIRALCRPFGEVVRVFVPKGRTTGLGRGFAFVTFADRSIAERCIARLDGHGYDSRIIRASFST